MSAARSWSLGHPHPDHEVSVQRILIRRSIDGAPMRYGTALRCSCGDPVGRVRVSNLPPWRSQAQVDAHYHAHVEQALAWAEREAEPVFGEPPCL